MKYYSKLFKILLIISISSFMSCDNDDGYRALTETELTVKVVQEYDYSWQKIADALGVSKVFDYDSGADADVTLHGCDDSNPLVNAVNLTLDVTGMASYYTFTYNLYNGQDKGIYLTGSVSAISDMTKDALFEGTLTITGRWSGTVRFEIQFDAGVPDSGTYYVTLPGGVETAVDFDTVKALL